MEGLLVAVQLAANVPPQLLLLLQLLVTGILARAEATFLKP